MAARPPANDEEDDAGVVEFGIPAVEGALEDADLTYPIEPETVVDATGDPDVPVDTSGRTLALSTALERTARSRYDSRNELLNALHQVFEDARRSRSGGVVGLVRSLIPGVGS